LLQKNRSLFWRNVGKLVSGTFLGQLTALIALPLITRVYLPEDIGSLSVINSLAGTIVIISSLRLERALILTDKEKRIKLFYLCVVLVLIISSLSFAVLLFQYELLSYLFNLPSLDVIFLVPIIIILKGFYNILSNLSNSYLLYTSLSLSIIVTAVTGYSLKVILGYFYSADFLSLIISELVAVFLSIILLFYFLIGKEREKFKTIPSFSFIKKIFKEENDFLKYDNLTSLLNNFSWLMPVFFLSWYFDNQVVGYYSLGFTLLRMPMNLLGKSIGNVFYKSSSLKRDKAEIAQESINVIQNLMFFGMLPSVVVLIYGEDLFTVFLGDNWSEAGVYSQILSLWTLIWLVSSPISNLFYTLRIQKSFLKFMIVSLLVRGGSFIIGGEFGNVYLALILFSLTSILVYGYQTKYLLAKLGVSFTFIIKKNFREIKPLLVPIVLLILLNFWDLIFSVKIFIIGIIVISTLVIKLKKSRSDNIIEK